MSAGNLLLSECGYPHTGEQSKPTAKESLAVEAQPSCEPDAYMAQSRLGSGSNNWFLCAPSEHGAIALYKAAPDYKALRAELKHWKSNHADVVKRLAIASQRPDLPVDRIAAIKEIEYLQAENTQLKNELNKLKTGHGEN